MDDITRLLEEIRGEQAPAERFDPRTAGVGQIGNPNARRTAGQETSMSKVAVFGAGSWGTAFSVVLADAGNDVTLWGRREELCATINEKRENTDYLPGVELPDAGQRHARPGADAGRRRVRRPRGAVADAAREPHRVGRAHPERRAAGLADEGRRARLAQADERGDRGGHRRRPRADRRASAAPTSPRRSPAASRPPASSPASTRTTSSGCGRCATPRRSGPYSSTDVIGCELGGAYKNVIALASGWPSASASATTPPPR